MKLGLADPMMMVGGKQYLRPTAQNPNYKPLCSMCQNFVIASNFDVDHHKATDNRK